MKTFTLMLVLIFFVILECCESVPSKPDGRKRKKNSEGPRMEVLKVDGEGRALVVVVPRENDKKDHHDIKKLDKSEPELKIERTDDGLKLIKNDREFSIDTETEHKKGNFLSKKLI